jgi:hypothetical protein
MSLDKATTKREGRGGGLVAMVGRLELFMLFGDKNWFNQSV